jgi:hypothetical protein
VNYWDLYCFSEQTFALFKVVKLRLELGILGAVSNFACLIDLAQEVTYLKTKQFPREVVSNYCLFHGSDETTQSVASSICYANGKLACKRDLPF